MLPGQFGKSSGSSGDANCSVFNSVCSKCSKPGGARMELSCEASGCISGRPRTPEDDFDLTPLSSLDS